MKYFLLILAFYLLSNKCLANESIKFIPNHEINADIEFQAQFITAKDNKGKFFLDEKNLFIVDFYDSKWINLRIDSAIIEIESLKFKTKSLGRFALKNFKDGEKSITIKGYSNGTEVASQKVNLTLIAHTPVFKNDAIVLGLLIILLAIIFYTSSQEKFNKFYTIFPSLLLCYFLPSILNWTGLISGEYSQLYYVSSRYLLPASLILLCLSVDLKSISNLGYKAVIMFFTGTIGIIIGGPIALLIVASIAPDLLGADASEIWRGLATVAGSWIGGGANQAAMKEIYHTPNDIFSKLIVVDVLVANLWMAFLLYGAGISNKIDKKLKADNSAIEALKSKMEKYVSGVLKIPTTTDLMVVVGIGLGGTAIAHILAELINPYFESHISFLEKIGLTSLASSFFWLVVFATVIGVTLSYTKLKQYEGAGASKVGSIFLYVLVASIGMHMDIGKITESLGLFVVGLIWMLIHAITMITMAKMIKAPFFFVAVGSQANVGGAASAPVVASAFNPALAPVGVLLAVLGYAVGTGGAWLCAEIMKNIPIQ